MFRLPFVAAVATVMLLTACDPGAVPMPTPTDSRSPSPIGFGDEYGWLVEAENDYVAASSHICSYEDMLLANPDPEYPPAVRLEANGGLPDDYQRGDHYQVDSNGITLEFDTGHYTASRIEGAPGFGTIWDTEGEFTFERDAQGVIAGGGGTGITRIVYASGDQAHPTDAMTFKVTVAKDPPWCES